MVKASRLSSVGSCGFEPEDVVANLEPRVATLEEVEGAGHRAQMDPLVRRAALGVGDVALERLEEERPTNDSDRIARAPTRGRRG